MEKRAGPFSLFVAACPWPSTLTFGSPPILAGLFMPERNGPQRPDRESGTFGTCLSNAVQRFPRRRCATSEACIGEVCLGELEAKAHTLCIGICVVVKVLFRTRAVD